MLSRTFKCLCEVYFGEGALQHAGRAAPPPPLREAISPPPRLEASRPSILDLGEALSNESCTPGAVSRLLGNVSFLYVNKSFPAIALITAGCC